MDSGNLTQLAGVTSKISDHILDYALLLAAIGTITMALIELLARGDGAYDGGKRNRRGASEWHCAQDWRARSLSAPRIIKTIE